MNKSIILIIFILILITLSVFIWIKNSNKASVFTHNIQKAVSQPSMVKDLNPLSIEAMRNKKYPGSDLVIEQTLTPGSNYSRYIASYKSDGLKIYGLLTVPQGDKPKNGWPVIIFNHGYIPPLEYRTTERYIAYTDAFSKNGYILFKPDFRGNGQSEGQPEGTYYSPAYTTDALNALSSVKKYKGANSEKIGMWGHSMGGNITLRSLVVNTKDVKAAVIWGGVVGSYIDILNWHDPSYHPSAYELSLRNKHREEFTKRYGTPATNPDFWNSIDPTNFLSDIQTPIQLHHGESDEEVPLNFATELRDKLQKAGKPIDLYSYPGADHNISSPNFEIAMQRSITFFDKYLK